MIDIIFGVFVVSVCLIVYLSAAWGTAYFVNDYLKNKLSQQQIKLCVLVSFFVWPLVWIIVPIFGLKELCNSK